jgi:hypothetical protein
VEDELDAVVVKHVSINSYQRLKKRSPFQDLASATAPLNASAIRPPSSLVGLNDEALLSKEEVAVLQREALLDMMKWLKHLRSVQRC